MNIDDYSNLSYSTFFSSTAEINAFFSYSEHSIILDCDRSFSTSVGRFEDWVATSSEKRKTALATLLDRLDSINHSESAFYALLFICLGCPSYAKTGTIQTSIAKSACSSLFDLGAIPVLLHHIYRFSRLISLTTSSLPTSKLAILMSTALGIYFCILIHCKTLNSLPIALSTALSDSRLEDVSSQVSVGGSTGGAVVLLLRILSDGVECSYFCSKKLLLALNATLALQLGDVASPITGSSLMISRVGDFLEIFKDHVAWKYPPPTYPQPPAFIREALAVLTTRAEVAARGELPSIETQANSEFENIFRQIFTELHRLLIIFLRILLHVGPNVTESVHQNSILDPLSDFSIYPSSLLILKHSNPNCDCNKCRMSSHEVERHREIVSRSVSSTLLLLLYHAHSNSFQQFLYIRSLVNSASGVVLMCKILNLQTGSQFQSFESDPVLKLLEHPVLAPPDESFAFIMSAAQSAIPPQTPSRLRILDSQIQLQEPEEGESSEEEEEGEVVDRCEDVPLSPSTPSNSSLKFKIKNERFDGDLTPLSTPMTTPLARPIHRSILTPLTNSGMFSKSFSFSKHFSSFDCFDVDDDLDFPPKLIRTFSTTCSVSMILEGLLQSESAQISQLNSFKVTPIFLHIVKLNFIDIKIVLLRIFRRMVKFLGKKWAMRHSEIITDMYMLSPASDAEIDEYLIEEFALYCSTFTNNLSSKIPNSSSFIDDHAPKGTKSMPAIDDCTEVVKNCYEKWFSKYGVDDANDLIFNSELNIKLVGLE
ncbi:hypothetical protein RCL1_003630 [Eukaryota sp. TZLM3-RCL]